MIIRKMIKEDIENGLLDAYKEGYIHHLNGWPDIFKSLSEDEYLKDFNETLESNEIIVICEDEKVTGYLAYKISSKKIKKLNIEQLAVLKEYQNKGFGKKLIQEASNIASKENCKRIELNCWAFNEKALFLYENIGFTKQRIILEKTLN